MTTYGELLLSHTPSISDHHDNAYLWLAGDNRKAAIDQIDYLHGLMTELTCNDAMATICDKAIQNIAENERMFHEVYNYFKKVAELKIFEGDAFICNKNNGWHSKGETYIISEASDGKVSFTDGTTGSESNFIKEIMDGDYKRV